MEEYSTFSKPMINRNTMTNGAYGLEIKELIQLAINRPIRVIRDFIVLL